MRMLSSLAATLAAAMFAPVVVAATDLHDHWDTRCKACHGDAGAFARSTLRVDGGRLLGRHHTEGLADFLRQHYLTDELVAPVMQMLLAQASSAPVFKEKCAACHGSAAEFVRKSLTTRDGVLVGRGSGRAVRDFLQHHGGLTAEQVAPMVATLERVSAEVGGR